MASALVLSGGVGRRMNANVPKQYIEVSGKPIIIYTLEKMQASEVIDSIYIVVAIDKLQYLEELVARYNIDKVRGYANAGSSRQVSILNGLLKMKKDGVGDEEIVLIHDSVRPLVSLELIQRCVDQCVGADGVMPVLSVKDTMYLCKDNQINCLLDRSTIYSGQSPEAFIFGKYFKINVETSVDELDKVKGSSEMAFKNGLLVKTICGDENNYKITTPNDLERFILAVNNNESL